MEGEPKAYEARWAAWAQQLRRWGLAPWVGAALEAGDPVWTLGLPLLETLQAAWPSPTARAFFTLFLHEDARHRFVQRLMEGEP